MQFFMLKPKIKIIFIHFEKKTQKNPTCRFTTKYERRQTIETKFVAIEVNNKKTPCYFVACFV
jgi:hypothetical protein